VRSTYLVLVVIFSVLMVGCGGGGSSDGGTSVTRELTSVQVTGVQTSYIVGVQSTITVTGIYNTGPSAVLSGITWTSSVPAIATINASGTLTPLAEGVTTITGSVNGESASAEITVVAASLSSIQVVSSGTDIPLGSTRQLSAQGTLNSGVTNTLSDATWTTSDATVLSVSNTGLVTANATGTATITAEKDGISGTLLVTVTDAALVSINISVTDTSVAVGTTTQAQSEGTFSDSSTSAVTVTWASSNEQVATINAQGLITGVGTGDSIITASGGTAITSNPVTVTITDSVITGIDTSPMFTTIPSGLQEQLGATLILSDNSTQPATSAVWSTSDESVATVTSANGVATITAQATGTVTITATSDGFSSEFSFSVVEAIVTEINFDVATVTLPHGVSKDLSVIATLSDNSTSNVTASSAFSVSDSALGAFAAPNATTVNFTAGSEGTGTLKAEFGAFSTPNIPLEVTAAVPEAIVSSTSSLVIPANVDRSVTIAVRYSDDSEITPTSGVAWTVADSAIASVSASGGETATITGVSEGTTTVTATVGELTYIFSVEVSAALPLNITFTIPTIYSDDDDLQLVASADFSDGSTHEVTEQVVWSSSDESIATVSNETGTVGTINPISQGSVDITATFSNTAITETVTATILQPRLLKGFSSYSYNRNSEITIGEGDYAVSFDFSDVDSDNALLNAVASNLVSSVTGATSIDQVTDTDALTFGATSVNVTQNTSQAFASIENANGITAVIQIHEVKTFENNLGNIVMFSWAIRTDGGANFSNYSVEDKLMFFSCRESTTSPSCGNSLNFSYNGSANASVTVDPRPEQHTVGSFVLIAIGKSYTVTNVTAEDTTNTVVPTFGNLVSDQVIAEGHGINYKLLSPPTFGEPVSLVYRYNIENNTSMSFTFSATFTSN
jgi:hypothetical protein